MTPCLNGVGLHGARPAGPVTTNPSTKPQQRTLTGDVPGAPSSSQQRGFTATSARTAGVPGNANIGRLFAMPLTPASPPAKPVQSATLPSLHRPSHGKVTAGRHGAGPASTTPTTMPHGERGSWKRMLPGSENTTTPFYANTVRHIPRMSHNTSYGKKRTSSRCGRDGNVKQPIAISALIWKKRKS